MVDSLASVPASSLSPATTSTPLDRGASAAPAGDGRARVQEGPPAGSSGPALGDQAHFSAEGLAALRDEQAGAQAEESSAGPGGRELTEEEQVEVRELRARDREVRAHEQAHKAAAGSAAQGGPTYEYESGPDGRRYAVGGEVPIRLAEGRTPAETIEKARRVQRAALAPAEPSAQDRAVAAEARQLQARAQADAAAEVHADEAGSPAPGTPEVARGAGGAALGGNPGGSAGAEDGRVSEEVGEDTASGAAGAPQVTDLARAFAPGAEADVPSGRLLGELFA